MLFQGLVLRRAVRNLLLAGTALGMAALATPAHAQDATWNATGSDATGWTDTNNWTPATVPLNTATFVFIDPLVDPTATTVNITAPVIIETIQFNAGANAYTFNLVDPGGGPPVGELLVTGQGIVNNSSNTQTFNLNACCSALEFTNNATAGNATIINVNAGGLFFTGNASAGNATIINNADFFSGAVSFGQPGGTDTATAGNATIIVNNNGLLEFNASTNAGNASITVSNGSAAFFDDNSSAANATINIGTGAGALFQGNSTGGNASFIIAAGGSLDFTGTAGVNGVVTAGSIDGSGFLDIGGAHSRFVVGSNNLSTEYSGSICTCAPVILEKVGTGTWILSGDNLYDGSTIITGGTLQLGNGGTTGSLLAGKPIINNSILSLNRSDTVLLDNDISGTGILNHNGAGTTILLGNNTYTGATNINAGTLQGGGINAFGNNSAVTIASNSILDSGGFDQTLGSLAGGGIVSMGVANLTIGGNNISSNFSGSIGGTGALIKNGSGVLTLSGNNLYTGATTVNGGGLVVNGSIASSSGLTVANNAFVGGIGTLPTTTINGGVFAPGNSIGTITVQGNLTFGAGSVYQVEVDPNDADRTNVTGTATLAGTVQAIALPGSFRARTYTILNAAGGINGAFDSLTVTGTFGPGARNPHLTYDANNVFLVLEAGTISPLLPAVAPRNSQAVATALDAAVLAGATPPAAFDTLFNFSGQGLVNALTQLDGEVATGMQQAGFKSLDLFLGAMLNPFLHGRGEMAGDGPALAFAPERQALPQDARAAYAAAMPVKAPPPAPASFGQRWSIWGSAYGGTSNTDGDAVIGSRDTRTNAYGFAAGVDHRLMPDTLIGFALAGGGTSWSLAGGLGSGRSNMFQAGIYGSHRFAGSAYISAAAAYTWHDASTNRNLTLAGVGQLDADFHAHSFGARIEGGYRWLTPFAGITPYGAAQVLSIRTPGYAETGLLGAAPFALAYNSQTTTATRTELGLWFDRSMLLNPDAALTLRARAAWAHDFDDERHNAVSFQTLPLVSFTVFGASPAQDYALLSGAAELRLRNGWSFALKGDAELANRTQTFSGNGTLRYAW